MQVMIREAISAQGFLTLSYLPSVREVLNQEAQVVPVPAIVYL